MTATIHIALFWSCGFRDWTLPFRCNQQCMSIRFSTSMPRSTFHQIPQQVKVLAMKPENLSLIPGSHSGKRKVSFECYTFTLVSSVCVCAFPPLCVCMCVHVCVHVCVCELELNLGCCSSGPTYSLWASLMWNGSLRQETGRKWQQLVSTSTTQGWQAYTTISGSLHEVRDRIQHKLA